MRLLLIEDDRMIGESLCEGLGQDGYTLDWVRDAEAAEVALAAHTAYGALLLDLGLPRCDGIEVLRELKDAMSRHILHALDEAGIAVASATLEVVARPG